MDPSQQREIHLRTELDSIKKAYKYVAAENKTFTERQKRSNNMNKRQDELVGVLMDQEHELYELLKTDRSKKSNELAAGHKEAAGAPKSSKSKKRKSSAEVCEAEAES